MLNFLNNIKTLKVKTFLFILFLLWIIGWFLAYTFRDSYHFHSISERSVNVQKECLDHFLAVFHKHKIPIILFDIDILPKLFQPRPKTWHRSTHKCKTLCKYHPDEKNVITFAIKGTSFDEKDDLVINDLENLGYTVHLSLDVDPRLIALDGTSSYLPTYLWIAKNDHVIHVAFLHERLGKYFWIGPVRDYDWKETVDALAPALTDGWHSMENIGAKFPTYAQVFDNSHRFLGLPLEIDGHKLNVPYFISKFLIEYKHSHFIECDYVQARKFKQKYETNLSNKDKEFKKKAKKLILKAKDVLDGMDIPFWLSSGTCLGWYRQCDIIPYSIDVDIGVFIYDYSLRIIESMHDNGLFLKQKLGKADDSLELSFVGKDNIKLDIFFFYEDDDHVWNGGTQAHDGQKYKYKFPKFDLCWTEFLEMKVRVPCDPKTYIEANYGKNWMIPTKDWKWNKHPPNMVLNGKWAEHEKEVAIQYFEKIELDSNAMHGIRDGVKAGVNVPEELDAHLTKIAVLNQSEKESKRIKDEA